MALLLKAEVGTKLELILWGIIRDPSELLSLGRTQVRFHSFSFPHLYMDDNIRYSSLSWNFDCQTYGVDYNAGGLVFYEVMRSNRDGALVDTPASEKQISALGELLRCGVQLGELSGEVRLYGARQVQATESPGFALARQLREFSQWIEKP